MRKSKVLNELKNGNFVGLPHIWTIPHWKIVDLLGYIGFPGVWIENEHGDFSEGEISQMILAARAHDMDAIVRIPRRDYTDTIKVLEAGATGVIVPHCMGVDDAKEIVKNARFHPIGLRGQGGSVDAEYRVNFDSAEYFKNGNSEIFLAVMVEDKEAVDEVEQIAALDGIDLVSFYALPEDNTIGNVLSGIEDADPGVLGEGTSAIYDGMWLGTLLTINPEDGYWIKITTEDSVMLDVEGLPTDPGTIYELEGGSNLISYPFAGYARIEETIPTDAQASIIGIIAEGAAAYNDVEIGWLGGLIGLSGTEGYWFITSDSVNFAYNPPVEGAARMVSPIRSVPLEYSFSQSTQQAFYFVESATIGDDPIDTDDLIIAYNGDIVIGSRYWYGNTTDIPAMGIDGSATYAGYGQSGDRITFKVLDASTNTLIDMNAKGETVWQNFGMTFIQLTDKVIPEQISFSSAYPNPFNPVTMISFGVPTEMEVQVVVHDMLGRTVTELASGVYTQGYYELQWDASQQSSGIYFVTMVAEGQKNILKLMLVK